MKMNLQIFGGRGGASGKSAVSSSKKINASNVAVYSEVQNPRGSGNWHFRLGGSGGEEVSFSGKYSEAKKKAIKYAAEKGVPRITTLK